MDLDLIENVESEQAEQLTLTAYNLKTKEKNRPILNAVIFRTSKGGYLAKGEDTDGTKLNALLGATKALKCIEAGLATKGWED